MRVYENLLAFSPSVSPEDRKVHEKELEKIIDKHSGKILNKNELGQKYLGYEVKKHREAYLVVWDVQMDPSRAMEYRRALQLYPNIIKYMVTHKLPKKPAPPRKPRKIKPESETESRGPSVTRI